MNGEQTLPWQQEKISLHWFKSCHENDEQALSIGQNLVLHDKISAEISIFCLFCLVK